MGELADYLEENKCSCDVDSLPSSDMLSALAGASPADGSAMAVKKPFVIKGSSPGSSLQSKYLSRWFPRRLKKSYYTPNPRRWPWPRTNVTGRIAGRWLPVAGYAYGGYDLYRIGKCLSR